MSTPTLTHQDTFLLGRTSNYSPTPRAIWFVTADVKLSRMRGVFPTVDHHRVTNPDVLSITFTVGPRRAGSHWQEKVVHAGQVPLADRNILGKADDSKRLPGERQGFHLADRINDLWENWHLNHMQAGCSHQPALPFRSDHPDLYSRSVPECKVTGYRYGAQWLVKPLDPKAYDLIELLELTKR